MKNRTLRQITAAGVIAAAYAALSLVLASITFGPVQCRVSEALTLLPVISPAAIWGVTLGCAVTNGVGAATGTNFLGLVDLPVGTAATLLAALLTALLTKALGRKFWSLCVAMVVGCAACYVLGTIWFMILTGADLVSALGWCVLPYLPGDAVKIVLAAVLTMQLDKRLKGSLV